MAVKRFSHSLPNLSIHYCMPFYSIVRTVCLALIFMQLRQTYRSPKMILHCCLALNMLPWCPGPRPIFREQTENHLASTNVYSFLATALQIQSEIHIGQDEKLSFPKGIALKILQFVYSLGQLRISTNAFLYMGSNVIVMVIAFYNKKLT